MGYSMRLELTRVCSLNGFQLVMVFFMNAGPFFFLECVSLSLLYPHLLLIFDTVCMCVCSLARSRYLSFFSLFFQFYSVVSWNSNVHNSASFFFLLTIIGSGHLVVWLRLGDPFVYQNPREFCVSCSPRQIPGCAYTTCLHSQI